MHTPGYELMVWTPDRTEPMRRTFPAWQTAYAKIDETWRENAGVTRIAVVKRHATKPCRVMYDQKRPHR